MSVVVLVDHSASFAPLAKPDLEALDAMAEALIRAVDDWPQPISFYWSIIGDSGFSAKEPCGPAVVFRRSLLPSRAGGMFKHPDELQDWFQICLQRFKKRNLPTEQYTDISGAIQAASQAVAVANVARLIVVLSDFSEDLPDNRAPVRLALNGERVVMLPRPNSTGELKPNEWLESLETWERRLMDAGVSAVCRIPVKGLVSGAIDKCLGHMGQHD